MLEINNFVLEIYNIQKNRIMKKGKVFMLTAVLVMFLLLGFGMAYKSGFKFMGLDLVIFILIVVLGAIALYRANKKDKSIAEGFPEEDEMSLLLKYKAGYYGYLASMYMWVFIFLFKDHFPDTESMIGGGILMSGLIGFIAKIVVKRNINE